MIMYNFHSIAIQTAEICVMKQGVRKFKQSINEITIGV